jgi:hypothetical protein
LLCRADCLATMLTNRRKDDRRRKLVLHADMP